MSESSPEVLNVFLNETLVGQIARLNGERIVFSFADSYLDQSHAAVLSQSFLNQAGGIIQDVRSTVLKAPPFFSNLLPEGHMRQYLGKLNEVNPKHDFELLKVLGKDLPGAVRIQELPISSSQAAQGEDASLVESGEQGTQLRFSLAGVQLKFSAVEETKGGLTIPAHGMGGDWIIKLPSTFYESVPENEFAMLSWAKSLGINVPEVRLVDVQKIRGLPDMAQNAKGQVLAIKRFDREDGKRIHFEDFAQIFGVYPQQKYDKYSYNNIASVIWTLGGEIGLIEYIKRLVFNLMIGNADMHLKNWSLLYPDGQHSELAPAYDFVSTISYINDPNLALKLGGTKKMAEVGPDSFVQMAKKMHLPQELVVQTASVMIEQVRGSFAKQRELMPGFVAKVIEQHLQSLKLV